MNNLLKYRVLYAFVQMCRILKIKKIIENWNVCECRGRNRLFVGSNDLGVI